MRSEPLLVLILAPLLGICSAAGQAAPFMDFYGYSYCDGDPASVGTTVTIPVRFDPVQPEPALPLDFTQYEVTGVIDGLEVVTVETHGPIRTLHYDGGEVHFYEDADQNSQWTVDPPNGSVPSTFENGGLILIGHFTDCLMIYDTVRRVGTIQGHVTFTGGSRLNELPQESGWLFFGGATANPAGGVPHGYSMAWDPQLLAQSPVPVHRATWGAIKAGYR